WTQLAHASADVTRDPWGTRPASEFVDRLKEQCAQAATARTRRRDRELLLERILARRTQAIYAAIALAGVLCALALGTVVIRKANIFTGVLLFGLLTAGAVGAAVRTILAEPGSADPRTALLLGCIAGLLVGLAYLIPQWVAAPGALSSEAVSVSSNDRI